MWGRSAMLALVSACGRIGFDQTTGDDTGAQDATATACALGPEWTPQWNSLISYLPFDGAGALAAGAVVPAAIGPAGITANLDGAGMTYAPGKVGQAIRFDGTDDVVALDLPSIDTTAGNSVTVAFWFNWTGMYYPPQGWTVLVNFPQINLLFDDGGTPPETIGFNTNHGDQWGSSNAGFANRWVHAVAVFFNGPSDQSILYIDGQRPLAMQTEATAFSASVEAMINIGAYPGYPNFYPGLMDDIAIWNRALTAEEVQTLYTHQTACN